ncbi:MAG: hypothetical protein ACK5IP_22275 [Paracoccus sp. (in: a-proteobacteria)]
MPAITVIAWLNFLAAGAFVMMALSDEPAMMSPAVIAAISGCIFLAIDRALTLLREIRDRLPAPEIATEMPQPRRQPDEPVRNLEEIEADLARMRSRIQS